MSVNEIPTNVHSIPVVFDVNAPTEEDGARVLANFLQALDLVRRLSVGIEIESWSMPNNEDADGSDHEGWHLEWVRNEPQYIVIVGRLFPDRDEVSVVGPFNTENEAQEFIESASDDVDDHEEPTITIDEVEYAEVMYMNRP